MSLEDTDSSSINRQDSVINIHSNISIQFDQYISVSIFLFYFDYKKATCVLFIIARLYSNNWHQSKSLIDPGKNECKWPSIEKQESKANGCCTTWCVATRRKERKEITCSFVDWRSKKTIRTRVTSNQNDLENLTKVTRVRREKKRSGVV